MRIPVRCSFCFSTLVYHSGEEIRFVSVSELLFALLPDFVLAYTIHLLAHDPDWEKPDDVARLSVVKS